MRISSIFIERPVLATVLSAILVIAGYLTMQNLPITEYPEIVPPQVQVVATYPGANAETLAETVAAPLEQAINGIDQMLYINSTTSSAGTLNLTVTFDIGTDINRAEAEVNNKVQGALNQLPTEVQQMGVKVNRRSTSILKVIAMYSPDASWNTLDIANYNLMNVQDELRRIAGVGEVRQFGSRDYSMRIWLDPARLAAAQLTPLEVFNALKNQNKQFAAGRLAAPPSDDSQSAFTYTLVTEGRLTDVAQFKEITLRADQQGVLRLGDVARVELGAQSYNLSSKYDGQPAVPMGIFLNADANALEVAKAVDATMARLAKSFPPGLAYANPYDTSEFVEISINKVILTLFEALILVILVVFLFLQNWRATLIPVLAIPVSIVGTFAGLYLLDFSINQLTLFGLILAIGIVVDDAIIVIENVERIMRTYGLNAKQATLKAMEEVTGPIIAIVLVLAAVFIPVGFVGGLTGEMYKQFAITIVVSVSISGLVALTLTPALCAHMLKDVHEQPERGFFGWFNRSFSRLTARFTWGVELIMKRALVALTVFVLLIVATWGTLSSLPKGLVPQEDKGTLFVLSYLPPASSLERTEAVRDQVTETLLDHPGVEHAIAFAGFDLATFSEKTDSAIAFVKLKHWDQRTGQDMSSSAIVGQLFGQLNQIEDAFTIPMGLPTIMGMSMTGGFEFYLQNRLGTGSLALSEMTDRLIAEASKRPEIGRMRTTFNTKVPQYQAQVDRDKAQMLKVPLEDVYLTLQATLGSVYINDFTLYGRNFRVNMQADSALREGPGALEGLFVRSALGEQVSLASLVTLTRTTGADIVDRFNLFQAAKIMGEPAPGFSSGQAIKALEELAESLLDDGFSIGWVGEAYQEKQSQGSGGVAFLFGVLFVYLILAALYERWMMPAVVLTAVPFAVLGSSMLVLLSGLNNDIYFELGLLTLIGLSAKNAILIVEFAMQKMDEGMALAQAAVESAKLRFRPIVMTSLAFTIGAVPLMLSTGAGAAARESVGTGVVGGMIFATLLAPLFVPMFFYWASRLTGNKGHVHKTVSSVH